MDAIPDLSRSLLDRVPQGSATLLAMLLVFLGLWLAGRLLSRDDAAATTLSAWSALYLLTISAAVLRLPALPIALAALPALAIVSLMLRERGPGLSRRHWPWAALSAPVLVLGALLPSFYDDSYLHWLPNALYMFERGHFLAVPLGGLPSLHPTYPPALGLLTYLGSSIAMRFAEATGPLTNVLLSVCAAASIHRLLASRTGVPASEPRQAAYSSGLLVAVAFSIVLLLNPAVQWVHYWSALADPAIGVIVLITMLRWCEYLAQPGAADSQRRRSLVMIMLLAGLISGIKHSGWQIALVMAAAGVMLGLSHRIPRRLWLAPVVAAGIGAGTSWAIWKIYLVTQLPVDDQFSILPLARWHFDQTGILFKAVIADFAAFARYYILLLAVIVAGLASLARRNPAPSLLRLLLGFAALAMPMHFVCLVLGYLGTGFFDWEIARAASLQRYTTHFGFATCAAGLTIAAVWALERVRSVNRRPATARAAMVGIAGVALIYAGTVLYPSLAYARYYFKEIAPARQLAVAALSRARPGQRVAVMGADWPVQFAKYVSWAAFGPGQRRAIGGFELGDSSAWVAPSRARIVEWQANPLIDVILIIDAQDLAVARELPAAPNHRWSRASGRWNVRDL